MSKEDQQNQLRRPDSEGEMLSAFWQRASSIIKNPDAYTKDGSQLLIGLEVEVSVLDNSYRAVTQDVRDRIISGSKFLDVELGAAQAELRTTPFDLKTDRGFRDLSDQLEERQSTLIQKASQNDCRILHCGSNPFVAINEIVRTDKPKYRVVPDFHNDRRRQNITTVIGAEGVDVGNAAVVSLTNACHLNIQSDGLEDAVDKMNRSLAIGPSAVALSGNSRFLGMSDTGLQDTRLIAWELSHDTRTEYEAASGFPTRVGLPKDYFGSIDDYFNQVSSYPFILHDPDHALEIGIGLFWRDARLKFYDGNCIVEFRPVSTQATPLQNLQIHTFFLGRLAWSQTTSEELLPMDFVRQNRLEAMISGTQARLWTIDGSNNLVQLPAKEILPREIERSEKGLEMLGLPDLKSAGDLIGGLRKRVEVGNLSEQTGRLIHGRKDTPERKMSLIQAFEEVGIL